MNWRSPFFLTVAQWLAFANCVSRKSEEFSFGEDSGGAKPDQQLQAILRDGPTHGVHSILWADNWNTISRWLPRQSLHDLELRVLMQMSANDSKPSIRFPIGNRLDAHVLLLHDEASGFSRKFGLIVWKTLKRCGSGCNNRCNNECNQTLQGGSIRLVARRTTHTVRKRILRSSQSDQSRI